MDHIDHDLVIVGGGAAGLRAAIAAAEQNDKLDVAVISKVYPMRSHTVSAEGGMAAVLREYDSFDLHIQDTLKGSDYLADQDAVEFFVRQCPREAIRLEHWGCPWSREPDGKIASRAFGGMSVKRTLFAADKTGFHLLHTLFQTSMRYEKISRHDEWFVTSILVDDGQVYGLTALNIRTGELNVIRAKAVILATGGAGKIYEFTTNGNIKTADGMAMAFRAGVPLKDMEFVQFHPTALPGTGILITEAARGEGGYLVNKDGERFLKRYVPNKMELGPRDILSRAIMNEIKENRALEGPYGSYVLLDLRHLGEEVIDNKLPFIRELARNYIGLDPVHEAIPVRPAQHYIMGGVHTDMAGFTGLPGLYAAGEVACVTINGANRLGSNSLAECLVFGAEAGKAAAIYAAGHVHKSSQNPVSETVKLEEKRIFDGILKKEQGSERVADIRNQMQHVTDTYVGIHREQAGLEEAARTLKQLRTRFAQVSISDKDTVFNTDLIAALELDFMLDTAYAVTVSALNRHESRGAHSRIDYPKRDDERFLRHLLAYRSEDGVRIDTMPVTITNWKPAERKY